MQLPLCLSYHFSLQLLLIQAGREVREGNFTLACATCHQLHPLCINALGMGPPEGSFQATQV